MEARALAYVRIGQSSQGLKDANELIKEPKTLTGLADPDISKGARFRKKEIVFQAQCRRKIVHCTVEAGCHEISVATTGKRIFRLHP